MNLDFIAKPLGQLLFFIYNSLSFLDGPDRLGVGIAYGLSIIIFTLIIKLLLLPLTLKQYKSTANMQKIQPQVQEVQKRYKNDKEKLNTELMKVYKENNVNPAGGCLPILIQFPIIITLYWVIVQPLKLMLGKTPEQITSIINVANDIITKLNLTIPKFELNAFGVEIKLLNFLNEHADKLVNNANIKVNELINMNFLGLELGHIPSFNPSVIFGPEMKIYLPLLILPILGVVTTFISAKISMPPKIEGAKKEDGPASSMQNSMLYIGPIMTLIFSFQLPASLVLYWSVGYIFQIFQQRYVNKHIYKRTGKQDVMVNAETGTGVIEGSVIEQKDETAKKPSTGGAKGSKKAKKKGGKK